MAGLCRAFPKTRHTQQEIEFGRGLSALVERFELEDFETQADCERRQKDMLGRFKTTGISPSLWEGLDECDTTHCARQPCTEGCNLGTLKRRITSLKTGLPLLAAHPGPHCAVTIVHPLWEAPVGELSKISIAGAIKWNARRLCQLRLEGLLALGSFEVSLNRELDGRTFWAGEIQQIVAGASKDELRAAFAIEGRHRKSRPGQRMLDVCDVGHLPSRFAYGQKRLVQERRAYVSKTTGRQNRRHLPPSDAHWAQHDEWLLGLPLGARIVAFGCRRRGTVFSARK